MTSGGKDQTSNSSIPERRFNRSLKPLVVAFFILGVMFTIFTWYSDHQQLQDEVKRLSDILTAQVSSEKRLREEFDATIDQTIQTADRQVLRAKLQGRPITLTGVKADGRPFDWTDYAGKLVVVHCWSSESYRFASSDDFSPMKKLYGDYHDVGLNIVGLSLDSPGAQLEAHAFLKERDVPWTNLLPTSSQGPQVNGISLKWPMTLILVNKDGYVVDVLDPGAVYQRYNQNLATALVDRLRIRLYRYLDRN